MLRFIVALLLFLEPVRFAMEAITVLPTLTYRGWAAAGELLVHAMIAALCAAAALALWNGAIDAARLATIAVVASIGRTFQSLFWSTLPNNTPPGDELFVGGIALLIGSAALVMIRRTG